jgi:histidyl-tRNA synthetase
MPPTKAKAPEKEKVRTEAAFSAPEGMEDVFGEEWLWRDKITAAAKRLAEAYDFWRIETPILESADLFMKAAGEATDLVEKELYTLKTRNGDNLALRSSGIPGIARAYMERKISRAAAFQKFWYEGQMFRHERVAAGRLRQFHQIGFDIIGGPNDPFYDAQTMVMFWKFFEELKIKELVLLVNSTGCRVCRPIYIRQLQSFYRNHLKDICTDCDRRLKTNPLRLLDCRKEGCVTLRAEAPNFFDKLCSPCSSHFTSVLEYLEELKLPYTLDNTLTREVEAYNRTVFEIAVAGEARELGILAGGGRYDYLFETLGLKSTPGVGGAAGIERVIAVMKTQGIATPPDKEKRVFIIHVGELAKRKLIGIIEELRRSGVYVSEAMSRESLQGQLKFADRDDNKLALILGQKEVFEESIIIRDLRHSTQETVPWTRMVEEVKRRLK